MPEALDFPQYRKYKNGKSLFKIISDDEFTEIQIIGSHFICYTMKAKILPDRNFIADMLHDYQANWEVATAEEYDLFAQKVNEQTIK